MALPFHRRSAAQTLYPTSLAFAYSQHRRIWDPDWALWQDEEIYEVAMRDPVFSHAARHRKHLVAGPTWTLDPASEDERDQRAAEVLERLLDHLHGFSTARFNLSTAIFTGSRLAIIRGERRWLALGGGPRRPWWVPTGLVDVDKRRLLQRADRDAEGRVVSRWFLSSLSRPGTWDEVTAETPLVRHAYDATEDTLGYGRGLLESAYTNVYARAVLKEKGLQGAGRWAQGILVAKVGDRPASVGKTRAQIAQAILDNLEKSSSEHVHAIDKEDELTVVTGGMEGHQIVTGLYKDLGVELVRLVLAANLPTGGDAEGSYSQSVTEKDSTMVGVRFDREALGETLTRDLVGWTWKLNRANLAAVRLGEAGRPRLRITQDDSPDTEREARVADVALRAGIALREDEVYRKIGYTAPKAGEPVLTGPPAAAFPPGGPGAGFPAPAGGFALAPAPSQEAGDDERLERFAARAERAEAALAERAAERDDEAAREIAALERDLALIRASRVDAEVRVREDAEERHRAAWRAEVDAFGAARTEAEREADMERTELFKALEAMRADQRAEREALVARLERLAERPHPAAPAPPPPAFSGLTLHVDRAEFQAAAGQPQVFQVGDAQFAASERNADLDASTARALDRVGQAIEALATREPKAPVVNVQAPPAPPAPKVENKFVVPEGAIKLEAKLEMPRRTTRLKLPDGREAVAETTDAA